MWSAPSGRRPCGWWCPTGPDTAAPPGSRAAPSPMWLPTWRQIADAQGWARFAVTGFSGGGPHALACAALLTGRVTCCAVIACPCATRRTRRGTSSPGRTPVQAEDFRLALFPASRRCGPTWRPGPASALAQIEAGAEAPSKKGGYLVAVDTGRMTRLRAQYLPGLDGRVDDVIALAHVLGVRPRQHLMCRWASGTAPGHSRAPQAHRLAAGSTCLRPADTNTRAGTTQATPATARSSAGSPPPPARRVRRGGPRR